MESKHINSTLTGGFVFLGFSKCAHSHPGPPVKKLRDLLEVCEEVKKWAENENTGCCQCFPSDCSVVWHWSRRLLGLGPIHLCLGSSLSNAIWTSEAIVSLKWQPELGCFYLSSSGVKKEEERNNTNTSWYVFFFFFYKRYSLQRCWPSWYLDTGLTWSILYLLTWFSFHCLDFMGEIQKVSSLHEIQNFPVGKELGLSGYLIYPNWMHKLQRHRSPSAISQLSETSSVGNEKCIWGQWRLSVRWAWAVSTLSLGLSSEVVCKTVDSALRKQRGAFGNRLTR